MALDAGRLKNAIKGAVDSIDVDNGEVSNDDVLDALAQAIISEITSNAEVIVVGGSSAGTYGVT